MNRDYRRQCFRDIRLSSLVSAAHVALLCIAPTVAATEYFVDKNHPSASDSNDGLATTRPFKTLERGVLELRAGNTLTIKAGVYREALVHGRSGTSSNPATVRAFPGQEGAVIIRGSDVVTGWTSEGNNIWSAFWQPLSRVECWSAYCERREMVFVDGSRLEQVLSKAELAMGRFWVDDGARKYYIGQSGDPNDRLVEISVRDQGIWAASASHVHWKGLTVEHVANAGDGAIQLGPNHTVLNCRVENNNRTGIKGVSGTVIRGSSSNHNGGLGIGLNGDNSLLDSNETSYNSWRQPRDRGGIKVIVDTPSGNRIVRHTAKFNLGRGIWFDTTESGNVVESCYLEGNLRAGLQFEATNGPNWAINNIIIGTRLIGDDQYPQSDGIGIAMREARDTYLYNNTIVGVAAAGILISGSERHDGANYVADTEVVNNIIVDSGTAAVQFWVWGSGRTEERAGSHHFNNNLYHGNPTTIIFPNLDGHGDESWTLAEWQTNRGEDLDSLGIAAYFTRKASNDLTLLSRSPAIDAGRDLAQVTTDFAGSSRPKGLRTDMGAFEASSTVTPTPTPTPRPPTTTPTRTPTPTPTNTPTPIPGQGSIIVEKQAVPNGDLTVFSFTGDAAGHLADKGQLLVSTGPGSFTSTEVMMDGWSLLEIRCDDSDSIGSKDTATATFNVSTGETVTCVFTNCADSQSTVEISHVTVTGTETITACNTLTAGSFSIEGTGAVRFRAGNKISLGNGFSVATGGIFTAELVDSQ